MSETESERRSREFAERAFAAIRASLAAGASPMALAQIWGWAAIKAAARRA